MKATLSLVTLAVVISLAHSQRQLAFPDPRSCQNSEFVQLNHNFNDLITIWYSKLQVFILFETILGVRHTTWTDPRGVTHNYFFSWEHQATQNLEVDWLDARNICRRHCMDTVSLETPAENEFIKQKISSGRVKYIWTSGRKCNFKGLCLVFLLWCNMSVTK